MLASLMGSSILSEVLQTPSILRTELSSASAILDYRPLGSCSRAAGWSASDLCSAQMRSADRIELRLSLEAKAENIYSR